MARPTRLPRPAPAIAAWRATIAPAALLLGMTVLAYLPALRGGFIWDDPDYVTQNPTLLSVGGLVDIWLHPSATPQYYPLVHTSFWIEYHLWQLRPLGYHLDNVLLHAGSAILLWIVLRRLRVPGAWLAGAIFAVHPVMVESVAWVTERKNVLSLAFYLGAALCYMRCAQLDDAAAPPHPRRWYVAALLLFVAALLSKTVTASLPAALLLLVYYRRGRLGWADVRPLLPMFALGLVSGAATAWLERGHVGAWGPEWAFSPLDRILIAGRALWFYFYKLIVPLDLSFIYPRWTIDASAWWQYAWPLAALVLLMALLALRPRCGRGPLVAILFFGGTLLPALGFVNVFPMRYSFVADHFQYHASIGIIALLAAGIAALLRRFGPAAQRLPVAALLGVLMALSFLQARTYRDPETLWRATLARNPSSWMVHVNLARELLGQWRVAPAPGLFDEAGAHLRRALELAPHVPDTQFSYGQYLGDRRDWSGAIEHYRNALRLADAAGRGHYYPNIHNSLGLALFVTGDVDGAIAQYLRALALEPRYPRAHFNLGVAYEKQGDPARALQAYAAALEIAPQYEEARYNAANLLRTIGHYPRAAEQYRILLQQNPRRADAHANLAATLLQMGRVSEALHHYAQAARLDPSLRAGIEASLGRLNLRLP